MATTTFAEAKSLAAFLLQLGLEGSIELPAGTEDGSTGEYYFVYGNRQTVICADLISRFRREQLIPELRQIHEAGLVGQDQDFNSWLLSLAPVNTAIEKTIAQML